MANLAMQKKEWSSSSSFRWEELNPEILALILVRIPIEERVGHASLVCKNWLACVSGSYCWCDMDIQDWCQKRNRSVEDVDRVARKLMKRSRGSSVLLSAYNLGNPGFIYAANSCGKNLKVLKMPISEVTDKMVERHVGSLVNLSVLDISYCLKITSKGIAEFGNNCKGLVELIRNMPSPLEVKSFGETDFEADDCEAIAIANTMSGLRKLEMCYGLFGDLGLDAILANCKALSHLNIDGCWKVNLGDDLVVKCLKLEYFVDPFIDEDIADYDDDEDDDECSDSY